MLNTTNVRKVSFAGFFFCALRAFYKVIEQRGDVNGYKKHV